MGPRKLDDNQIGRMLQKRNQAEFIFYKSGILDEKVMKRKGSQIKKEHKMSIPIKTISLNEHKMSNLNITGEF